MSIRLRFIKDIKYILILSVALISCNGSVNKNTSVNTLNDSSKDSNKSLSQNILSIDLDTCKAVKINQITCLQNRTIDTLGESDTLKISSNLTSILSSQYLVRSQSEDQQQITYSKLRIFYKNELVFQKDSVFAGGMFEYITKDNLLSFPIINEQSDDLSTGSDLYLVDLNSKTTRWVGKSLTNTVNAFFSIDGKSLFYLDNAHLFKYDYLNSSKKDIMEIHSTNGYIILQICILTSSSFEVMYMKDMSPNKLYKSIINLKFPLFG